MSLRFQDAAEIKQFFEMIPVTPQLRDSVMAFDGIPAIPSLLKLYGDRLYPRSWRATPQHQVIGRPWSRTRSRGGELPRRALFDARGLVTRISPATRVKLRTWNGPKFPAPPPALANASFMKSCDPILRVSASAIAFLLAAPSSVFHNPDRSWHLCKHSPTQGDRPGKQGAKKQMSRKVNAL